MSRWPSKTRVGAGRLALLVTAASLLCPAVILAGAEGVHGPMRAREEERTLLETSEEFAVQLQERGIVYNDPELQAFLQGIGDRLAPEPTDSYLDYRFSIVRDPLPNAFALADGRVYVHTGLLALMDNEAQLAMLLAHEINHAAGHHLFVYHAAVRNKLIQHIVLGPLIVTTPVGAILEDLLVLLPSIMGYGRDLEEEADRRGLEMVVEARYDVYEAPVLFEILGQDHEAESVRTLTKWSSHPELAERAAYLTSDIGRLAWKHDLDGLETGNEGFRVRVRQVSLDTVADLIRDDRPRSAVALARRLVGEGGGNAAAAARAELALGDAYLALGARTAEVPAEDRSNKENKARLKERRKLTRDEREAARVATPEGRLILDENMGLARRAYIRALALDPELAEARRGLGLTHMRTGSSMEAGKELSAYLKVRPAAPDRKVILRHLQTITRQIKEEKEEGDK